MHTLTTHPRSTVATHLLLASVALVGVAWATTAWGPVGVLLVLALVPAALAAEVDGRTGRIPDRLVVATAAPPLVVAAVEVGRGAAAAVLGAVLLGAVVSALPLLVVHLVAPDALGFGDVKLAAALGLGLGLVDPRLGMVALCVGSFAAATFGLVAQRRSVPLGPGLVLGAIAAHVLAERLGGEPLPWR